MHRQTAAVAAAYERAITRYPAPGSALLANHGNWQGSLDYTPQAEFGDGVLAQFQGLEVRIPAGYDAYLRRKYGDYWQDPPPEAQRGHPCLDWDPGPEDIQ